MGQKPIFSAAGRRDMVKAPSEAVRPSLNVTIKEETNKNSLSHHGETAMDVESREEQKQLDKHHEQSSSSAGKNIIRTRTESEQVEEREHEDGADEVEEEAQEPVTRRAPKGPTKEEKEKHEATHLPFREWCQHCIRGRGRNKPRKKKMEEDEEENKVTRISIDYFFMS